MSHPFTSNRSTHGVFSHAWWAVPPLLMGILAISGQSFWIDECMTARFVSQPTLAEWGEDMRTTNYPESQMPLYVSYLWCWGKLFGHGEVSLRLAALPWFVPGIAVFLYSLRRVGTRGAAIILVTCSSAFLWYYLDEARPYAIQAGVSCLIFASLAECQSSPEIASGRWFLACLAGLLLLSAISIIGMVWISAAMIAMCGMFPVATLKGWSRRYRAWILVVAGLLGVLGAYYFWTVLRGAKATMIGATNWQSILFVLYEQLGFAGLGPGRTELREQGARALVPFWPWLCFYAAAVGTVLVAGVRVVWNSSAGRPALWIVAGLIIPVTFFLVAGMLAHFRVLGRHLTPLVPVWLFILSCGVVSLWRRAVAGRMVVLLFLVLGLASAFEIRWASRHRKDDYRSAVSFSKAALSLGHSVWWNASKEAAKHYGLPLTSDPNEREKALLVFNPGAGRLGQLPLPDLVVVSKPDIFDSSQAVGNWLKQSGYQPQTNFPAFAIWGLNP